MIRIPASQNSDLGSIPIARSITHDDSIGLTHVNWLNLAKKWPFLDTKWTPAVVNWTPTSRWGKMMPAGKVENRLAHFRTTWIIVAANKYRVPVQAPACSQFAHLCRTRLSRVLSVGKQSSYECQHSFGRLQHRPGSAPGCLTRRRIDDFQYLVSCAVLNSDNKLRNVRNRVVHG